MAERCDLAGYERFDEILNERPPLPVGRLDLSELASTLGHVATSEPGYAWERVPRWLAQIEESFKVEKEDLVDNIEPIVCIDVGSSLPLYTQHLRGHLFRRSGRHASDLAFGILNGEASKALRDSQLKSSALLGAVSNSPELRGLLESAIQEILYSLSPADVAKDPANREQFRSRVIYQLAHQTARYVKPSSHGTADMEARWGLRYEVIESPASYLQALSHQGVVPTDESRAARQRLAAGSRDAADMEAAKQMVALGTRSALELIRWQADQVVKHIVDNPRYRPARFISLDISDPEVVAASSLANTPASTQAMDLFTHAVQSLFDSRQHIVADLLKPLDAPDNSITNITCFDGWPFAFQAADNTDEFIELGTQTLLSFYRKLAPKGRVIIFPWELPAGSPISPAAISEIKLNVVPHIIGEFSIRSISADQLRSYMSSSDRQTADLHSSIFRYGNRVFDTLILSKAKRSVIDNVVRLRPVTDD